MVGLKWLLMLTGGMVQGIWISEYVQVLVFVVLRVFTDVHAYCTHQLHIQCISGFPRKADLCQIIPTVLTAKIIVIRWSILSGPTQILCRCYLRVSGCITCRLKTMFTMFRHRLLSWIFCQNIIVIRNGYVVYEIVRYLSDL